MDRLRFTALLATTAVVLALLATPAVAEQRVALVIGNARYAHAPRLANPLNDAADIGASLARLGFAVTKLENADYGVDCGWGPNDTLRTSQRLFCQRAG